MEEEKLSQFVSLRTTAKAVNTDRMRGTFPFIANAAFFEARAVVRASARFVLLKDGLKTVPRTNRHAEWPRLRQG
jgi:hypothetical protein